MKRQAFTLFQGKQLQDAKLLYTRVCELDPADAESWFFLGIINGQLGILEEAERSLQRAVGLQPQRPEIHFNLGNVLSQMGKSAEAEIAYREALRLKPDMAAAHANLGTVLQNQGRLDEALTEHRVAVRLVPKSPEAHFNLGNLLLELKRFNDAVNLYGETLRLKPDFALAYYSLGIALEKLGGFQNAMAAYAEAVRLKPDYLDAWINWAGLLAEFGPREKALEYYRHAQALDPTCMVAKIGEAWVLERQGDFEQAYARLQPLLEMENPDYFAGMVLAALCRPLGCCDEAIALMEKMLERDVTPLDKEKQANLHFELGRLYDRKRAFDTAFRHYRRGNKIFGKARDFDAQKHVKLIDDLIQTYNSSIMAHAPRAQTASKRPVFIVGMPRSGTSLVEQILASHPVIFGGGELGIMSRIVNDLPATLGSQAFYPSCLSTMCQKDIDQIAQRYLEFLTALSPDAGRVTDKMPANFLHLGLINLLFPEARVIHCIRDPLDTCLSCYFQNFQWRLPYTQDLTMLGVYYRQYQRLMNHWKTVLDIPMLEVKYQEVVADQEAMSRTMIEFCGLPWDDRCLKFYETIRVAGTASYDQVRQPIYQKSIHRWKNYEAYLDPLKQALTH